MEYLVSPTSSEAPCGGCGLNACGLDGCVIDVICGVEACGVYGCVIDACGALIAP